MPNAVSVLLRRIASQGWSNPGLEFANAFGVQLQSVSLLITALFTLTLALHFVQFDRSVKIDRKKASLSGSP